MFLKINENISEVFEMTYYKQSKKRRIASAVIILVIIGCMLATMLLACLL